MSPFSPIPGGWRRKALTATLSLSLHIGSSFWSAPHHFPRPPPDGQISVPVDMEKVARWRWFDVGFPPFRLGGTVPLLSYHYLPLFPLLPHFTEFHCLECLAFINQKGSCLNWLCSLWLAGDSLCRHHQSRQHHNGLWMGYMAPVKSPLPSSSLSLSLSVCKLWHRIWRPKRRRKRWRMAASLVASLLPTPPTLPHTYQARMPTAVYWVGRDYFHSP